MGTQNMGQCFQWPTTAPGDWCGEFAAKEECDQERGMSAKEQDALKRAKQKVWLKKHGYNYGVYPSRVLQLLSSGVASNVVMHLWCGRGKKFRERYQRMVKDYEADPII
jgi:hypothetical protein